MRGALVNVQGIVVGRLIRHLHKCLSLFLPKPVAQTPIRNWGRCVAAGLHVPFGVTFRMNICHHPFVTTTRSENWCSCYTIVVLIMVGQINGSPAVTCNLL